MDFSKVTIQDCDELCEKKEKFVVLNDGKVIGFVEGQAGKNGNL